MKDKKLPFWTMSFLITGNVLGVGVLALPIKTGLSGYIPTACAIILIWAIMYFTALIIAKRITVSEKLSKTFDIPSFFNDELGSIGKWIAIIANLILLYGIITAYLSMVSSMINALFPAILSQKSLILIYFAIGSLLTVFGMRILLRGNFLVIIGLWICFAILLSITSNHFDINNLRFTNWKILPGGLAVIVSAFHFHNIVPTVCRRFEFNYKLIRKSIFIGTFIGLIMNIAWVTVVLGALPILGPGTTTINYAFMHSEPATVPLVQLLGSHVFITTSLIFALLAVTASFAANGKGLLSFIADLSHSYLKMDNKYVTYILSFLPPLLLALGNPHAFLRAISIVGGVGEAILFGVLPAAILLKHVFKKKNKVKFTFILAVFILLVSLFIVFSTSMEWIKSIYF